MHLCWARDSSAVRFQKLHLVITRWFFGRWLNSKQKLTWPSARVRGRSLLFESISLHTPPNTNLSHLVALRCSLKESVVFSKQCIMHFCSKERRTSSIFNFIYFDFAGPKPWASSFSNWLQARFAGEHCKARTRGLTREGPLSMWKTSIKESLKRKLRSVVARKDYNTAHACAHTSFTFIDIDRLKHWYELLLRWKYPCMWIWIQKCHREIIPIHCHIIYRCMYNVYCIMLYYLHWLWLC